MEEFKEKRSVRKDLFNRRIFIRLIVGLVIEYGVFVLIYGINGWGIRALVDGLFVAAVVGIGLASFSFLTYSGFFDTIAVGTANLVGIMRREGKKKYDSLFDYKEMKKPKRAGNRFAPLAYLVASLPMIILFIVFYSINYV
ncbi:MAG: DUF3899 domain-containing protein [Bacilli bacterium]|nr:DUF3899 domain-containing protein [Bacilli bacterium]